jgi:hypothetical protein
MSPAATKSKEHVHPMGENEPVRLALLMHSAYTQVSGGSNMKLEDHGIPPWKAHGVLEAYHWRYPFAVCTLRSDARCIQAMNTFDTSTVFYYSVGVPQNGLLRCLAQTQLYTRAMA